MHRLLFLPLLLACHKDCPTYSLDEDGDGFAGQETVTCDPPEGAQKGGISGEVDCDDADPEIHPGQMDGDVLCDGLDNDCDGSFDEDVATYYTDLDRDGYGDESQPAQVSACDAGFGYSATAGDCDDSAEAVFPGAFEICSDGLDQDCDGLAGDADLCALSGDLVVETLIAVGGGWQSPGSAVAVLGDIDGDGLDDVAVGDAGVDIVTLRSGSTGASIGELVGEAKSAFGAALASGDYDGDGVRDLAVGAPRASDGVGELSLWFGPDFTRSSVITTRATYKLFGLTLATLPSASGADGLVAEVRVTYDDEVVPDLMLLAAPGTLTDTGDSPKIGPFDLDAWSMSLSVLGGSLAVGHSGVNTSSAGASVYDLADLEDATLEAALATSDDQLGLGAAVALLELPGTSNETLLVGAPDADRGKGSVFAISSVGRAGVVGVDDVDWTLDGQVGSGLGSALGSVGDINGDGLPELGLGGDTRAWLVFGTETALAGGSVLSADAALTGFGDAVRAVVGAGDVTGDGYGDVLFLDGSTVTLLFGGPIPAAPEP